jgi:hypothetical protein
MNRRRGGPERSGAAGRLARRLSGFGEPVIENIQEESSFVIGAETAP